MGSFSGPKDWGQLLTAMMTPFHKDGSVNFDEAAKIANWLVDKQRNDGIIICGTTGESPTLTHDEKIGLLQATLDAVGNRAAVIYGAGTYNTQESIENTKDAERLGAHGVMAVNPYYNRPGQEGMLAHFTAIAKSTSLPIMLYNIQGRSAINLETPTVLKLSEVSNIVAVKEASGNMSQIAEVCARVPEGFRVYSGDDGITLPVMSVGGHGIVSVGAHVCGAEMKEMILQFPSSPAGAAKISKRLNPVFKGLFAWPSPVPVKYALSRFGFDCEQVRLPLVELEPSAKSEIEKVLKAAGLHPAMAAV